MPLCIAVELMTLDWLRLLHHIQKVPDSNPETSYPDSPFVDFLGPRTSSDYATTVSFNAFYTYNSFSFLYAM
jgi:hypothetical protein